MGAHAQEDLDPLNIVLVGLVGCVFAALVSKVTSSLAPQQHYLVAQLAGAALSVAALSMILVHSRRDQANAHDRSSSVAVAALVAIVAVPCIANLLYRLGFLSGATGVGGLAVILLALLVIGLVTFTILSPASKNTASELFILPLAVVSVILLAGSPGRFEFLSRAVPPELLAGNILVRNLVIGAVAVAVLFDVGLGLGGIRRSVVRSLARQRARFARRKGHHAMTVRSRTELGRVLRFAIYDFSELGALAAKVFTTGVYVIALYVRRSIVGLLWSKRSLRGLAISLLILAALLLQDRAEYVLSLIERSTVTSAHDFELLVTGAAYIASLGFLLFLLTFLLESGEEQVRFAFVIVVASFVSGMWIATIVLRSVVFVGLLDAQGYGLSPSPFVVLGLLLLLLAVIRAAWSRRARS
jgi:hypothetical protein